MPKILIHREVAVFLTRFVPDFFTFTFICFLLELVLTEDGYDRAPTHFGWSPWTRQSVKNCLEGL